MTYSIILSFLPKFSSNQVYKNSNARCSCFLNLGGGTSVVGPGGMVKAWTIKSRGVWEDDPLEIFLTRTSEMLFPVIWALEFNLQTKKLKLTEKYLTPDCASITFFKCVTFGVYTRVSGEVRTRFHVPIWRT